MKKPEILVIDENTKILFAFESLLEREGCIAITAESSQEALLKVAAKKPRVIFVDISIPNQSNLKTIKKLRENDPTIPLILITSQRAHEAEELVERFNATGYLEKPFSILSIRSILKELKIKP